VQHIVFGLADSLPAKARPPSAIHADKLLDAGHGACLLRDPQCAQFVQDSLLNADAEQYRLLAWCVMPNHVHVLIEQLEGFPLGDLVHGWKSSTAHRINTHLSRTGRLWRREYFDRFMRDDAHLFNTTAYVEENPVSAGLAQKAGEWRFSSAHWRL
jgi:REP element-mobilizing transposase RayT